MHIFSIIAVSLILCLVLSVLLLVMHASFLFWSPELDTRAQQQPGGQRGQQWRRLPHRALRRGLGAALQGRHGQLGRGERLRDRHAHPGQPGPPHVQHRLAHPAGTLLLLLLFSYKYSADPVYFTDVAAL